MSLAGHLAKRVAAGSFLALGLSLPTLAQPGGSADDRWVIVHAGHLMAVPGKAMQHRQSIIIKNGLIDSVRDGYVSAEDVGISDAQVISLRDRFVLPGLMDMHVHLTIDTDVLATLADTNDANLAVLAAHNARKTLMAGFTTVRDVGSIGPAVFSVRDGIAAGLLVGPRIFASGRIVTATAGHGDEPFAALFGFNQTGETERTSCDGPYECRKMVREQIRAGSDVIKISAGGGGFEDNGYPSAPPELLDDEIGAAVEAAHGMLRPVAAHAHATASINAALRHGVDSIEHGTFLDSESIRLFKETGAVLVPTLAYLDLYDETYIATQVPPRLRPRIRQFLQLQPEALKIAYRQGVTIAVGTDFGFGIPHGENARELIAYVERIGMTPQDAVLAATVNGARLLRQEASLGTLEPGKYADIIATDISPLDDIHALTRVAFVMKNGIVYKGSADACADLPGPEACH